MFHTSYTAAPVPSTGPLPSTKCFKKTSCRTTDSERLHCCCHLLNKADNIATPNSLHDLFSHFSTAHRNSVTDRKTDTHRPHSEYALFCDFRIQGTLSGGLFKDLSRITTHILTDTPVHSYYMQTK